MKPDIVGVFTLFKWGNLYVYLVKAAKIESYIPNVQKKWRLYRTFYNK